MGDLKGREPSRLEIRLLNQPNPAPITLRDSGPLRYEVTRLLRVDSLQVGQLQTESMPLTGALASSSILQLNCRYQVVTREYGDSVIRTDTPMSPPQSHVSSPCYAQTSICTALG